MAGVSFVRGDARQPEALRAVGALRRMVEYLAEPSVLAPADAWCSAARDERDPLVVAYT